MRRRITLVLLCAGCWPHRVPSNANTPSTRLENSVRHLDRPRCSAKEQCPASMVCVDQQCYTPCSQAAPGCPVGEDCARVDIGCECNADVFMPSTFRCLAPSEMRFWSEHVPTYRFTGSRWRLVRHSNSPSPKSPPKDGWSDDCAHCPSGTRCFSAPEGVRPRCLRPCSWDGDCAPGEYCECETSMGATSGTYACVEDDPQGSGLRKNVERLSRIRSPNEPSWCSLQ